MCVKAKHHCRKNVLDTFIEIQQTEIRNIKSYHITAKAICCNKHSVCNYNNVHSLLRYTNN